MWTSRSVRTYDGADVGKVRSGRHSRGHRKWLGGPMPCVSCQWHRLLSRWCMRYGYRQISSPVFHLYWQQLTTQSSVSPRPRKDLDMILGLLYGHHIDLTYRSHQRSWKAIACSSSSVYWWFEWYKLSRPRSSRSSTTRSVTFCRLTDAIETHNFSWHITQ